MARAGAGIVVSAAALGGLLVLSRLRPDETRTVAEQELVANQGVPARAPGKALDAWSPDRVVSAGEHYQASSGEAMRVGTADGIELTIEPGGRLDVTEAGATKRFLLKRGAVQTHVRKLRQGERFIIDTAQAEVEVHGTRFRVALEENGPACASATVTHVSVSEGVVTVVAAGQGEASLFPGDEWISKCAATRVPERDPPTAEPARARGTASSQRRGPARRSLASARVSPSMLSAQNTLFASAARARRDGQPGEALARFDRFLREYPDSSLFESALVQRMRVLTGLDRAAAKDAATQYVARFPDGFGRGEARLLLSGAAPAP
jgi:hypothetical protein